MTSKWDRLSDYELAAEFADVARWRPSSQDEAFRKGDLLEELGAAMDTRDVRLEDWDITAR